MEINMKRKEGKEGKKSILHFGQGEREKSFVRPPAVIADYMKIGTVVSAPSGRSV